MAERNGRVEITAEIDQRLQSALSQMSSSLRSTIEVTNAVNRSTDLTKSTMRGLSQALTVSRGSTNEYNRSVTEAVKNQAILASHFGRTKEAITSLNKIISSSRGTNVTSQDIAVQRAFINQLEAQLGIQKELQRYSNTQSLMAQSNALNSLATKYSYAGNRLSMGLTLPLMTFFRTAFSNYRRLEIETVRTTKLLGDSYTDAGAQIKTLGKELDDISLKYGVARDLVQGLAGDYAELGITDIKALAGLTDLTAATEKLGNVDITEASNFIKSIYQTVNRVKRDEAARAGKAISFKDPADEALFYADSIAQVRGQLAMFNLLENKTSLSLQDIAKAFPELTAASTSFGLSMTEASALIIPMVASGFQVGASANSVKVSLQRLVAMTKKNQEAIKELKLTQADFNFEAGVGIDTIQKLSDGYENLKKTRGDEGALRFFSDLFGVRQGPRMEVALQNLSQFQSQISKAGTIEDQLVTQLESYVRQRAGQAGLGEKYSKMEITKYADLSKVIRLSQNADKDVASTFTSARADFGNYLVSESKKGQDLLGKVTTETGRALFAAASGGGSGSQAEATFNVELEKALDTADRRYKTSRESLKALGREMVPVFDAILKVIVPLLQKFATFVQSMPTGFKAFLTIGGLVLAMLGPIMKIRGAFAQLHSSVLSFRASGGIFKNLKSSIHPISAELLASSDAFLRFKNKLTQVGNQFFFKGTIKELKQMEKLIAAQSSGRTRVSDRLEKKLKLKETADYSGLYEETSNQLKNVFDESLDGYLKPYSGIKPDITGTIIDGRVVGLEMGNAFVSVLTSLGFDPRSFTRVASTAGASSSTADDAVVVPANIRRTGSRTTPPTDDGGPDGGPSGSGPSGGSPSGGSPAGGSPAGGATRTGPRVRNPMSGMEQVWGTLEETMNFVNSATKKQLQDFAKSLSITKVSGLGVTSAKLKVTTLRRAILEAINAPKELVEKIAEDVKTTAEQVKETVNNNAPPAADTTEVKEASTKATENVAEAQADVDATAVVEQGKEDEKTAKETKPKTGKKPAVKKKSEEAADSVAVEQAKVNAKAAEEQGKVDAKEVSTGGQRTLKARLKRKPFLKVDKNLEGTIGAFSHLTSTINEMVANAQQVQKISVEEAIAKLNLGIENSKKLRFTPRDFTRLAELMGVILPQAFYEIQEFTNQAGKPLQIQADSLQNIINAIAKIVPASESLPELAGKKVLKIEQDLNRAFIALEKQGGTKAFNIGNAVGTLRHTLNEAINMMIPKENLKEGVVVPLEELTYSDLGTGGRRSKGRKPKAPKLDYDDYLDGLQDLTKTSIDQGFLKKLRKNLEFRAGKSLFEKSMTEESLNQSFGPATGEVTEGNVRVARALSFGRAKSRGSRALFRRELDLPSSLDKLTEEAYNAHRAKIEKGIADARTRMETIKTISGAGLDLETDNLSLDQLKQAYADFEREMREGALNEPIDKVIEKLKGQSEIISKNRNRPGRLTAGAGSEDVVFDLEKMLDDRLKKANEALQYEYDKDPIPENRVKASTRAVFVQIAKDLQYAYMEQLAKFQKEIDRTIPEVSKNLAIAEQNVETARGKLKDVKALKVGSEEGKEYFKGRKKTDVVESLQKELSLLEEQRNIIKSQYEELVKKNKADQQNIAQLARVRDEQLAILNIKREEAGLPRTVISGPATEDASPSSSERAEAYWKSRSESMSKVLKQEDAKTRAPDAIATPAAPSNTVGVIREIPKDVDKAQRKLQQLFDVKEALQAIYDKKLPLGSAGDKMEASVKKFFKVETIPKDLFDFFEKINKEIEKAKTALNKAQTAAGSGGGRAGSVNLGMPMAGGFGDPMSTDLSPRGGRRSPLDMMTPRNIMSMIPSGGDLTPDLSGVIETLFKQISQAIGAPAEVMAGVLKDIDDRAKKVSTIVNTSLDQFDNELVNKLITQIQGLLGDSELTVENIYNAILGARTQIYGMVPKEIKGNIISGKATAEQVTGLVEALNLYNVSKEELLKLDARTLRKIAEKMKLEGRSKASEAKLAELIHNAIFNLDKETINAIDLVSLMPVVEAGATVKTTAQRMPKKPVQQKLKEEVVKLEDSVEEVIVSTEKVVETATKTVEAINVIIKKNIPVAVRIGQSVLDFRSTGIGGGWKASDDPVSPPIPPNLPRTPGPFPPPRKGYGGTDEQNKFAMGVLKVMDASILAGKAVGSFYLSVMRAGTMMLPFGKTVWNIGSGFVSLTQSAIALYKSSKEAGTGLQGVGKTLKEIAKARILGGTYTNAKGEQVQSAGVLGRLGGTAGSIKQAFSGAAGSGIQGLINTATMGMGQFGFVAGNVLQNLTSALQTIPYVGGPVVGILGAIAGSIYLLIKSSTIWKGTNEEAFKNFKDAWQNIKDILSAIAGPFEDFIGTLLGAPEAGANATDSAKSKLLAFSNFILNLSNRIESFVKDYIVPAIRKSLEIVIYLFNAIKPFASATVGLVVAIFNQITNRQANMVKKAGDLFKQGTQEASAGNFRMVDNAIRNVKSVEDAWATFKNSFKNVWEAITSIVQYYLSIIYLRAYMFLNLAMAEILQSLVSLFFEAGQQMGEAIQNGMYSKIKGPLKVLSNLSPVARGLGPLGSLIGMVSSGAQGVSNNFFDKTQTDITSKFNKMIKAIESSGQGKAAFDRLLNSLMPKGAGSGLFKSFRDLLTKVFKDPTAANAAADNFKDAVNSALSNLKENFFNAALSGLSDAVSKIKSEVSDILETQKEEYLKAYDDQIAAIDAMVEAEQRLTATEEYEADKRQRIKDRELQRQNYQKNRTLAIYEGRIDDARQLDLEEQKNISDFNKENADAETARNRDLQGNARADAKAVIEKQRLEASKLFDQAIKDFNEYVETVGKNGTLTEAQLTEQWKKISEEAEKTSKGLYDTFKTSFEALPGAISAVTNSAGGLFNIPYDKLIEETKKQFGIGNANADSILGLTRSMLTGQGSAISSAFDTSGPITKSYSEGLEKLKTYIATKNSGEGEDSLKGIFKKIIADANEAAKQEILKGQRGLGSAFAELMGYLNKELSGPNGLALKEIVAKQLKEAIDLVNNTTIPAPRIQNRTDANGNSGFGAGGQRVPAGSNQPTPGFDPRSVFGLTSGQDTTSQGQWWSRFRLNNKSPWNAWSKFAADKLPMYQNFQVKNPQRWELKFLPKSIAVDPNTILGSNFGPVRFNGGAIPYGNGGPTEGPMHQGIPAILHGGEYVVRKSAVDKYGTGMLQNINQGTFGKKGGFFTGGMIGSGKGGATSFINPFKKGSFDPRIDTKDPAFKEWDWQQKNGGLNYDFLDAIAKKESAKKVTTKGLANWSDINGMRGQKGNKTLSGGFNMPERLWNALGGDAFAPAPGLASILQQMVINNRHLIFGWFNPKTNRYNTPRGTDAHTMPRYARGAKGVKYVNLPEFFDPALSYEENLVTNENRKRKSTPTNSAMGFGTVQGKDRYLKYWQRAQNTMGTHRMAMVQNPFSNPIWIQPKTGFIKDSSLALSNTRIVPAPAGFFKGGMVSGKASGGLNYDYENIGAMAGGGVSSFPNPPALSKKFRGSNVWELLNPITLKNIGSKKIINKDFVIENLLNNRYEVAKEMIKRKISTLPITKSDYGSYTDVSTGETQEYAGIDTYSRKPLNYDNYIDSITLGSSIIKDKRFSDYYNKILDIAYNKVYPSAKFDSDYLGKKPKSIENIPQSPSSAFNPYAPLPQSTLKGYEKLYDLNMIKPYDQLFAMAKYLSFNNKFKKLNVGFVSSYAKNHKNNKFNILQNALNNFKTLTGMPYQLFNKYLNIPFKTLKKKNELQMNFVPYGKKYGTNEGAGGDFSRWSNFKSRIRYDDSIGGQYKDSLRSLFEHEIGHAMGMYHTMSDTDQPSNYNVMNDRYESIMSYDYDNKASYGAGDVAYFQALRKIIGYKTPSIFTGFNGGIMPYGNGGPTFGPMHQGIPAVLHGGEYVVRKSAVDKYGSGMLQSINQGTFGKMGGYFTGGTVKGDKKDPSGKPPPPYKTWAEYFAAEGPLTPYQKAVMGPARSAGEKDELQPYDAKWKAEVDRKNKAFDKSFINRFVRPVSEIFGPMAAIKAGAEVITGKDLDAPAGSDKKANRFASVGQLALALTPSKLITKPIGKIASKIGISGIASKIGAKILPRTASGVPKIVGKLAGKFGGKISGLGEKYSSGFMGALNLEGIQGTMGIYGRGNRSWLSEILRADNIASRDGARIAGKEMVEAAYAAGLSPAQYLEKMGIPHPGHAIYRSGPLTSLYDNLINKINPFKQRVGIHIGSRMPGKEPYSQILPGINQFGPGDQQAGMTYSWLRGKVGDVTDKAMGFMGMEGSPMTKGTASVFSEVMDNKLLSDYYITKSIGKLFRDQNIVNSPSMRSGSQKVLEVLPGNATKEQLMEALAGHRKNAKIKNIFGGFTNLFKSGRKKFFPNEIEIEEMKQARIAANNVRNAMINKVNGPAKTKLSEIVGIDPEKVLGADSYPTREAYLKAMDIYARIQTSMMMEVKKSASYKLAQQKVKKIDKSFKPAARMQGLLKFIQNGVLFSEFDDLVGTVVDLVPGLSNKPRNVADIPWAGGLDKILKAEHYPAQSGGIFSKSNPAYTSWYLRPTDESEFGLDSRIQQQQLSTHPNTQVYKDDKGDVYSAIYSSHDFLGNKGKEFQASIPELFRKHNNTITVVNRIPKKDIVTRGGFSEALKTFGTTVGLKTKNIDVSSQKPFNDNIKLLQFLRGKDGFGLELFYDRDPQGAAAWTRPFDFPLTLSEFRKNKLKPRMTAEMGVGFSLAQRLMTFAGIAQKAFPFKFDNITDLMVQIASMPLKAIGPGNEGGLSTTAKTISALTQFKVASDYKGMMKTLFLHELGHNIFLEHTMGASMFGSYGDQGNPMGAETAIRSLMSYNAPQYDRYLPGDIRGFQAMLKPLPNISKLPKPKNKKFPKPKNKKFNGGIMPYAQGGPTFGPEHQEIPAILHGGEYVIRKSAVNKYGTNMLQNINQGIYKKAGQYKIGGYVDGINTPSIPKFSTPMAQYAKIAGPNVSTGTMQSESTHNYNFYVDNFIGETEWFNSMMKDYNMKVVPANQKQAGLESRVIRTYNGINRGM